MNISPVVGSILASFATAAVVATACRPQVVAAPPVPAPVSAVSAPASEPPVVPPALAADLIVLAPATMSPADAAVAAVHDLDAAVTKLIDSAPPR